MKEKFTIKEKIIWYTVIISLGAMCIAAVFIVFLVAAPPLKNEEDRKNQFPQMFKNEQEAIRNKGKIIFLKSKKQKNCVIEDTEKLREFKIAVYDQNSQGQFIKSDQFCIPSFYGKASLEFRDLLGNGQQFMFIKFEGARGTGLSQMILMIIGWKDGKFIPLLVETISYDLSIVGGYLRELDVQYSFKKIKTSRLSMDFKFRYHARNDKNETPIDINWTESSVWNEKTFSFYDEQHEQKMLKSAPFFVRRNIAKIRLSIKNVDIPRDCGDEIYNKTGVAGVLSEEFLNK